MKKIISSIFFYSGINALLTYSIVRYNIQDYYIRLNHKVDSPDY